MLQARLAVVGFNHRAVGVHSAGEEAAPLYSQDAGPGGSLEGSTVHPLQVDIFF